MTAYLLLPSIEAGLSRPVDFRNIGHLFAEPDEPQAQPRRLSRVRFVLTGLLILTCVIGDAVLVLRPDALLQAALVLHGGPIAERVVSL